VAEGGQPTHPDVAVHWLPTPTDTGGLPTEIHRPVALTAVDGTQRDEHRALWLLPSAGPTPPGRRPEWGLDGANVVVRVAKAAASRTAGVSAQS
jgi:hypothetical protein